jgi:hypothetical protein
MLMGIQQSPKSLSVAKSADGDVDPDIASFSIVMFGVLF